jgi:serine-type D-Ala-D-Ala carboxypeptidase/endopeptidase
VRVVGARYGAAATMAALLAAGMFAPGRLRAQSPDVAGAYDGEIGSLPATLHLRLRNGALTATLDHLDPAAPWMFTCSDLRVAGTSLTFVVPSVHATFSGTLQRNGEEIAGQWTQKGQSVLVLFSKEKFVPAAKPSAIDGIWLGTQQSANVSTRIQILVRSDANGKEYCTVDALDIYYMDMECSDTTLRGNEFSFYLATAATKFTGTLSADGNTLSGNSYEKVIEGTVAKVIAVPLTLTRQTALAAEKPRPGASYQPAMARVSADQMPRILAADLAGALKDGELAPATGAGVSIGVYSRGVSRVISFGAAKPDSIYEIGSITKTFTGLLLAQMAAEKKVRLDQPVRELLPAGAVAKPDGPEITLLDLAAQRSGLPSMPDNIGVANLEQPYADYRAADLVAYLQRRGVANPDPRYSEFDSLGFGLLGVALAERAGVSYGQLVEDEIAGPLGLRDTAVTLSPSQQERMLPGHDEFHGPAKAWSSDALAGAIALRSTASDMLAYLIAYLHPETIANRSTPGAATLPEAMRQSMQRQGELTSGMGVTSGWLFEKETGNFWHNGATAAYSSYTFFNPTEDFGAVVLLNTSPGVNGSFAEVLGRHVYQRLAGKPAISLGD